MELIKVWRKAGFTLRLWDTGRRDWRGQTRLAYELKDGRGVVFAGDDFSGSPLHADDSQATVGAILSFLSLRKGDTDAEYFARYTAAQRGWSAGSRCEELQMLAMDIEERASRKSA